ncbi:MAG: hypothetical protein ABI412_03030 [Sphingomicrobium sp.]
MNDTIRSATPMHLWIVGILATIWNCFGGYDYLMTRMENRDYLKSMMPTVDPQVTLDWVNGMPIWAQIGWGLGVWAALAGSLLLLLRSRFAVPALALSLVGMVMSFGQQFLGSPPPAELTQGGAQYMPLVIIAVGIALFFYSRAMKAKGVLA